MLEASHLKKIYETGSGKVYALDDVSFSVETGEFVAILGPSGCGKSTLLHILGGVDEPTEGEVCLDGNEYTKLLEKEKDALRRQKNRNDLSGIQSCASVKCRGKYSSSGAAGWKKCRSGKAKFSIEIIGFRRRENALAKPIIRWTATEDGNCPCSVSGSEYHSC